MNLRTPTPPPAGTVAATVPAPATPSPASTVPAPGFFKWDRPVPTMLRKTQAELDAERIEEEKQAQTHAQQQDSEDSDQEAWDFPSSDEEQSWSYAVQGDTDEEKAADINTTQASGSSPALALPPVFSSLTVPVSESKRYDLQVAKTKEEAEVAKREQEQRLVDELQSLFNAHEFNMVIDLAKEFQEYYPKNPAFRYFEISAHRYLGDFQGAHQLCEKILKSSPHYQLSQMSVTIETELLYLKSKSQNIFKMFMRVEDRLRMNMSASLAYDWPTATLKIKTQDCIQFPEVQYEYDLHNQWIVSTRYQGVNYSNVRSRVEEGGRRKVLLESEGDKSAYRTIECIIETSPDCFARDLRHIALRKMLYSDNNLTTFDMKQVSIVNKGPLQRMMLHSYDYIRLPTVREYKDQCQFSFVTWLNIAVLIAKELERINNKGILLGSVGCNTVAILTYIDSQPQALFTKFHYAYWLTEINPVLENGNVAIPHKRDDVKDFAEMVEQMLGDCPEYKVEDNLREWIERAKAGDPDQRPDLLTFKYLSTLVRQTHSSFFQNGKIAEEKRAPKALPAPEAVTAPVPAEHVGCSKNWAPMS